jgi:hypothetical protein
MGRSLAGHYQSRSNEKGCRRGRAVAPPDIETLDDSFQWFGDPKAFLDGRRYVMGEAASRLSDADLMPISQSSDVAPKKSQPF